MRHGEDVHSTEEEELESPTENAADTEAIKGLSGLIVLGNAWESPDVYGALADALDSDRRNRLGYLALQRSRELFRQGKHSLVMEDSPTDTAWYKLSIDSTTTASNQPNLEDRYRLLRAEADQWQVDRTEYMTIRLRAGRYPDTDPTFWSDYHSTPPPDIDGSWLTKANDRLDAYAKRNPGVPVFIFLAFIACCFFVGIRLMVLMWKYFLRRGQRR
jgi:hypothetical protein